MCVTRSCGGRNCISKDKELPRAVTRTVERHAAPSRYLVRLLSVELLILPAIPNPGPAFSDLLPGSIYIDSYSPQYPY